MKRFWTEVRVGEDGGVALDGRPVRTPGRVPLTLPTPALAEAVADEWRAVGATLDPRAMILTGLANAAIDRIAADPRAFAAGLSRYGDSDLLYYRAEEGPLAERQAAAWDPLLDWARSRYDVHFALQRGIMPVAQPEATIARLDGVVAALPPFALAGLSPVVTLTGSLVASLALVERAASADAVWTAAEIDEAWQAELWGEDAEATARRGARRREFDAAVRFLALLG